MVDRFGVPEWDTDPDMLIAPGGESWSGFVARASEAVRALAERHPGEQVVAAVHAGVIESTMIANLAIPLATSQRGWTRIVHASLTEWEWVPLLRAGSCSASTTRAGSRFSRPFDQQAL